jgi:hypothetical protein
MRDAGGPVVSDGAAKLERQVVRVGGVEQRDRLGAIAVRGFREARAEADDLVGEC